MYDARLRVDNPVFFIARHPGFRFQNSGSRLRGFMVERFRSLRSRTGCRSTRRPSILRLRSFDFRVQGLGV